MQKENLRPQRNRENNDKQYNKSYQEDLIGDKYSYERDQISKNDEEKII